jgi:hypothetical protein
MQIVSCPSCGARVDAAPGPAAYVHHCRFCGAPITIEPLPQAAAPTAPAPIQVLPERAAQEAVAAAQQTGRKLAWVIAISAFVPALIPVFLFVVPMLTKSAATRFGAFPITVDANDEVEIDDRDGGAGETLVTLGPNAKLTLRRCNLKGPMIVKAGANAQITIVDSTLVGSQGIIDADEPNAVITIQRSKLTSDEEIVDEGAVNTKVVVSGQSELKSGAIAFPIEDNGEVTVDHSDVSGKLGVIAIKNNGKVKLVNDALLQSDGVGVELGNNGHLTITSSRVETKATGVKAAYNLDATLRNATVLGPKASLDVGMNAHVRITQSSFNGPKIVPKGSTVESE